MSALSSKITIFAELPTKSRYKNIQKLRFISNKKVKKVFFNAFFS